MLPHLRLFCNCFSPYPHVRQGRPGTDGRLRMGLSHPVVLLESARYQTGPRRRSTVRPPPTLASYDAQATQTTTQQAAANERHWHERDLAWQHQCAQLRATRSCQALAVLTPLSPPPPPRGYVNTCFLGPLFAVDSPRCRPDDVL